MPTVLLVEDDIDILDTLEVYFKGSGFKTERTRSGKQAVQLFLSSTPDLVVLDIGLPEMDGLEVLKRIRQNSSVPVIMLTARVEEIDELLGLNLGADDYITKPFSPRVLMARVQSILRRSEDHNETEEKPLTLGELYVNPYAMQAKYAENPLNLTPTEFRMLHHLAKTPERAVSRMELLEVALPDGEALERAVDVHMKNLRRKLSDAGAEELIQTVWGMGYRLVKQ